MLTLDAAEKERIRLVELDHEKTNEFIKGVVGVGGALRASAVTVWLALLGFAFQQSLAALALLAAVVVVVFMLVDGYHGWLYAQAATHVRAVERVTAAYYAALGSGGGEDEESVRAFREALRAHRFGFSDMRATMKPTFLWEARPKLVYRLVYPLLLVLALVAALAIGPWGAGKDEDKPTRVIIEKAR